MCHLTFVGQDACGGIVSLLSPTEVFLNTLNILFSFELLPAHPNTLQPPARPAQHTTSLREAASCARGGLLQNAFHRSQVLPPH